MLAETPVNTMLISQFCQKQSLLCSQTKLNISFVHITESIFGRFSTSCLINCNFPSSGSPLIYSFLLFIWFFWYRKNHIFYFCFMLWFRCWDWLVYGMGGVKLQLLFLVLQVCAFAFSQGSASNSSLALLLTFIQVPNSLSYQDLWLVCLGSSLLVTLISEFWLENTQIWYFLALKSLWGNWNLNFV